MRQIIFSTILLLLLSSCFENRDQPIHHDSGEDDGVEITMDSILSDTSIILVSDLPIYFDSTRVLIHPIGLAKADYGKASLGSKLKSSFDRDEYPSSYFANISGNHIYGNLTNMLFDDIDKGTGIRPLTNKVINITNVLYLRSLGRFNNTHYLIYHLQDADTNQDGKINSNDITTLYLSLLNGTEFAKAIPDYQQLVKGEWVSWCHRYYFQTIEDVNKDGIFNKKDKYHSYYIDFNSIPYKVVEYKSLELVVNK